MKIVVDATGGDHYPEVPVSGSLLAIDDDPKLRIILAGPQKIVGDELDKHLEVNPEAKKRISILDAPEIIGMDESPAHAVKSKRRSSINLGVNLIASGDAEAFVSAGNTGALLASSTFFLGKLEGISRPTIAAYFPTLKGRRLVMDAGATLDVKPETYLQFAHMGMVYLEQIMQVPNPKVGLLNVGEEPEKGTKVQKEAFNKLNELDTFVGNIEGKDIMTGKADLYLCDGFVGNVLLKFGESFPPVLFELLKRTMRSMNIAENEQTLVKNVLSETLTEFDPEAVGGVPFLGVKGISMVGHGSSSAQAIKNMIHKAAECVSNDINGKIVASLK